MDNPFDRYGLQVYDGSKYDYPPSVPVVINKEGKILTTFPAGWSEESCWSAISLLKDFWRQGFEAGQEDIRAKLRQIIEPAQN
jgi:hypothetical protein